MQKKMIKEAINAKGFRIGIYTQDLKNEFISLTDIAEYRNEEDPRFVVQNWMRNRDTIEFLAVWEQLNNPGFNRVQFEAVKKEADLLNVALFGKTANEWKTSHPDSIGNMRDEASIDQLLILANMESYNAAMIKQGITQTERLLSLRKMAIEQMKTLDPSKTRELLL